jgi:FlaA1/EpsC-like NDP-sugar epimerase
MTRFNITLDESVNFVIKFLNMMIGGELFVPKLPSYKLLDLVYAIKKNAKIKVLGIRPGEKLHEEMISISDSVNCLEFDNFFIIKPYKFEEKEWNVKKFMIKNHLRNFKNFKKDFSYNSFNNKHYLTREELVRLIKKNILGGEVLN